MNRRGSDKKKHRANRRGVRPVWAVCLSHLLALGIALLVYALPHHVIPRTSEAIGTVSTRTMMAGNADVQAAPAEPEEAVSETETASESEPLVWELDLDETSDIPGAEDGDGETASEAAENTPVPEVSPEAVVLNGPVQEGDPATGADAVVLTEATPEPTAEPTPEPTEEPKDEVGSFRIRFADKFTEGKTKRTKTSYQSKNLNIKIRKVKSEEWDTVYYVVDIYVADISCFMTAFAQDKFGTGYTAWPLEMAEKYKSVVTMNGDYYGMRKTGVVIRNGKLYRNRKVSNDVCVLYWDGTMKTFAPRDFDANREMANGAYQAWNFGPRLLDEDGKARTKFNSNVTNKNPRSVVGYFEPGHYCFVAVDGRNDESDGLSMKDLATLMEKLGCKQAYNLDGGRTSMLYAGDTRINVPVEGGRKSSDFVMILDKVTK